MPKHEGQSASGEPELQPELPVEPKEVESVLEVEQEMLAKELEDYRIWFGNIFYNQGGGKKAVDQILANSELHAEKYLSEEERRRFKDSLVECESITDREEFISKVLEIYLPLLHFKIKNPKEYEKIERDNFGKGFKIRLSEVLFAGSKKDLEKTISIHFGSSKTLETKVTVESIIEGLEKLTEILEGKGGAEELERLAEIIKEKGEIEIIEANSWIFAKHSKLGKKVMGFENIHMLTQEEKDVRSLTNKKPMGGGSMSREEFLKKPWAKK